MDRSPPQMSQEFECWTQWMPWSRRAFKSVCGWDVILLFGALASWKLSKNKKRRYKDEIRNTPIHSIMKIHEDHSGPYSPTLERPAPFCSTLAQRRSNCNQPTAMKSSYLMQHPSNLSPSNQPYLGDTRFIIGICFNNLWKTPTARTNARVSTATLQNNNNNNNNDRQQQPQKKRTKKWKIYIYINKKHILLSFFFCEKLQKLMFIISKLACSADAGGAAAGTCGTMRDVWFMPAGTQKWRWMDDDSDSPSQLGDF